MFVPKVSEKQRRHLLQEVELPDPRDPMCPFEDHLDPAERHYREALTDVLIPDEKSLDMIETAREEEKLRDRLMIEGENALPRIRRRKRRHT